MAKIDVTVAEAIKELEEEEIELTEFDNKIKNIFKTKKSVFDCMKYWGINTINGIEIKYNFEVQSRYQIYISFKVIEGKTDKSIKDMKVKLISIERI